MLCSLGLGLAQCMSIMGNGHGSGNGHGHGSRENIIKESEEPAKNSISSDDHDYIDVDDNANDDDDDETTDSMDSIKAVGGSCSHQAHTPYEYKNNAYDYNSNSPASSSSCVWEEKEKTTSTIPRQISATSMDMGIDTNIHHHRNMKMNTNKDIGGSRSKKSSSESAFALKEYLAGAIDELNKIEKIQKQFLSLQIALEVQDGVDVKRGTEEEQQQKQRDCNVGVHLHDDCPSDMDSSLPTPRSLEIFSYDIIHNGKQRVEFDFSAGSEIFNSTSSSSSNSSSSSSSSSSGRRPPSRFTPSSRDYDWSKSKSNRDGSWSDGAMEELRELSDMRTALALLEEKKWKAQKQGRRINTLRSRYLLQGTGTHPSCMKHSTVSTISKQHQHQHQIKTKRVHSHPIRPQSRLSAQSISSRRQCIDPDITKKRHNDLERLKTAKKEYEQQKTTTTTPTPHKIKTISLRDSNRLYDRLVGYKQKSDEKKSALRKERETRDFDFDCAKSFGKMKMTLDQAHSASYLRDTVASRSRSRSRSICRTRVEGRELRAPV